MKHAIISAILTDPEKQQEAFNSVVSKHKSLVIGRMGLPIAGAGEALIAVAVKAESGDVQAFVKDINGVGGVVANFIIA
jgi:metal-responsive CopG/Arc/MetJ family transcriptional regulator